MNKSFFNNKPFDYRGNCIIFTATRCDFADGVEIELIGSPTQVDIWNDIATVIGYHATNVLPLLNGFQGYDCCGFNLKYPEPTSNTNG